MIRITKSEALGGEPPNPSLVAPLRTSFLHVDDSYPAPLPHLMFHYYVRTYIVSYLKRGYLDQVPNSQHFRAGNEFVEICWRSGYPTVASSSCVLYRHHREKDKKHLGSNASLSNSNTKRAVRLSSFFQFNDICFYLQSSSGIFQSIQTEMDHGRRMGAALVLPLGFYPL